MGFTTHSILGAAIPPPPDNRLSHYYYQFHCTSSQEAHPFHQFDSSRAGLLSFSQKEKETFLHWWGKLTKIRSIIQFLLFIFHFLRHSFTFFFSSVFIWQTLLWVKTNIMHLHDAECGYDWNSFRLNLFSTFLAYLIYKKVYICDHVSRKRCKEWFPLLLMKRWSPKRWNYHNN